jgi:hypothetical protein
MAQWLGQYTGLTHATRVADAEQGLRHAIEVLRVKGTIEERSVQTKIVCKLAKRVLSARTRLIKANLAAMGRHAEGADKMRRRVSELAELGVAGILAEFGAADVADE